jgi:hypothetical protein
MDEFDFDNDTNFSTSINSLKNKINNSENLNNKINNSENISNKLSIDEILNHRSHNHDADTFPCLTNKCKKYSIQEKNNKSNKSNKNTKNTKNINNNNKKKEIQKTDNIYIILIILFLLFNNYDLYLYLQNKGFSYYKSLIFRLIGFIFVFYLINNITI